MDKEHLDKALERCFLLDNKLKEKDHQINNLRQEIERGYNNEFNSVRELYISDPDRINLELYNELNYSRDLISRMTKLLNQEKAKSMKLEETLKVEKLYIIYIGM
jgi:hypothetical protein